MVILKGQMQGIGGRPVQMAASVAGSHHGEGVIGGNGKTAGLLALSLTGQITGAASQVEQARAGSQLRPADDLPPPADVLPKGHQAVHQVVAGGDAGEHGLDAVAALIECGHGVNYTRVRK